MNLSLHSVSEFVLFAEDSHYYWIYILKYIRGLSLKSPRIFHQMHDVRHQDVHFSCSPHATIRRLVHPLLGTEDTLFITTKLQTLDQWIIDRNFIDQFGQRL